MTVLLYGLRLATYMSLTRIGFIHSQFIYLRVHQATRLIERNTKRRTDRQKDKRQNIQFQYRPVHNLRRAFRPDQHCPGRHIPVLVKVGCWLGFDCLPDMPQWCARRRWSTGHPFSRRLAVLTGPNVEYSLIRQRHYRYAKYCRPKSRSKRIFAGQKLDTLWCLLRCCWQ